MIDLAQWMPPQTATTITMVILSALLGACVFRGDHHRSQFRFFSQHGDWPSGVWLSRQLIWLPALLTMSLLVHSVWAAACVLVSLNPTWDVHWTVRIQSRREVTVITYSFCATLLAYVAAQAVSVCISSGILAAVVAVSLAGLLVGWSWLMKLGGVPWWWSVAPLAVSLFLASWLRTSHWLAERRGISGWVVPFLMVTIPVLLLSCAVPVYRVAEIWPMRAEPEVSYAAPANREGQKTVELYLRARDQYVEWLNATADDSATRHGNQQGDTITITDYFTDYVEANRETLELLIEANVRPECGSLSGHISRLCDLVHLLETNGLNLARDGKLDAAFQRYCETLVFLGRLQASATTHEVQWLHDGESTLYQRYIADWAGHPQQTSAVWTFNLRNVLRASSWPPYAWLSTTIRPPIPKHVASGIDAGSLMKARVAIDRINSIAHRRGICTLLELAAMRLEAGSYPEHLVPLDNHEPEIWRLDPFTGQPFRYRPHGFATGVGADGLGDNIMPGRESFGQASIRSHAPLAGRIHRPTCPGHISIRFICPSLPFMSCRNTAIGPQTEK